ncbi:alanine/glycine:cation symporter family protein [Gaopeijia maritima]|uniref:Alanine/glycine:cation symporter family protein n=1 Tax=Gaopeijia maritima TaxID=3119007 RepID=A0ABU9E3T5_9BACT
MNLDQIVEQAVSPLAEALAAFVFFEIPLFGGRWPFVVLWLLAGAVFFTVVHRGINLRGIPLAIRVLRGEFDVPDAPGEVSHAQALSTALSGTVGIGNIGGVAVAIAAGGPGATLWMIVAGFLGMATKYVECTLGVRYRQHNPDGSVSGGPMFYLRRGFEERGFPRLGAFLGHFYAVGIVLGCLGIGNMFQSNQAFEQFLFATGGQDSWFVGRGWLFGLMLAAGVGAVIIGGVQVIARVTVRLVPFMGILYLVGTLGVIAINAGHLPGAVAAIIEGAFSPQGVAGGVVGTMVIGFQRAVFSNEAGIGSASIAHAAVKTDRPATEGLVALFGPFVDTVVICTLTALVIGVTAQADPVFLEQTTFEGVGMTSEAFRRAVVWSPYPLAVAALLFAFSTALAWSYYGLKGWTSLVGESPAARHLFNLVFCGFVALGSTIQLQSVLDFSDAMVFVLCVPNILGLVVLTPVVKQELARFLERV